ncbi:MAG TPA: polyamine aminopropyltransferase [Burkholderiales bacterium]|nr:polyamine aminopropyltransferase [Burkholderiales bacterium]
MNGLHLVANLYGCKGDARYLTDRDALRDFCLEAVRKAGLTSLGDLFHQFDSESADPGGVTGAIVLAESHLAIHTWPELNSVTLDVYVCNYTQDNSAKANQVLDDLMALFKPTDYVRHDVPRDQQHLYEHLNPDYGFFIRSTKRLEELHTGLQALEMHQTPQFGKLLRLDGCFMTSEGEEFFYHENLIHPALTAHAAPKEVLIIGGGDGGAADEVLKHPTVARVTLVELDAKVVEVSRKYLADVHHGSLDSPKLRLLIEDGLKFIAETGEKFDLIALDLPDPIGPAADLYEEAFFESCRRALAPGGVLTLHMGSPVSVPGRVKEHYARLARVFPIVRPYTVFIPLYGSLWSLAACSDTLDPVAVSSAEIDRRIARRGLSDLQYYNGATHQAVFALPNFVRDLTVGGRPAPALVGKRRAASGK